MAGLHQKNCHSHVGREAVARCPECGFFYCRECIAEHDDRLICAACLRKLLQPEQKKQRTAAGWFARIAMLGLSLMMGWAAFYGMGRFLLNLPTSFHDGTIWQAHFPDQ